MEYALKRSVVLLMLILGFLMIGLAVTSTPSLSFGHAAFAGEDCSDDNSCTTGGGSDTGGSASGGVNTGGGGTAEHGDSGLPAAPIALGGLVVVAGGTLLLRRRTAGQDA